MRKKLALLFSLLIFLLAPLTECAEDQTIVDLINNFIAFSRDVRMNGPDYIATAEGKMELSAEEFTSTTNDALNKHDLDKLRGMALVSHKETLHNFEIEKNGDLAIVTFLEDYEEVYDRTRGYTYTMNGKTHEVKPGYGYTTQGVGRKNKITLKRKDDGWIILEHKIYEFTIPKMGNSKLDGEGFRNVFPNNRESLRRVSPNIDLLPARPVNKYEIEEVEIPQDEID